MKIFTVDAFANGPFTGNPAAVCFLTAEADEVWMQSVAAEMNLSETAFVLPIGNRFSLRWFTPVLEVDLCGHATLATAHLLFCDPQQGSRDHLHFDTKSGELTAVREGEFIRLDFPSLPAASCEPADGLIEALGVKPTFVARSRFDYIIEVATEQELQDIRPDFDLLRRIEVRGVIVTTASTTYDFASRFFAPGAGVNEDPATGSAHCVLAPYWSEKLGKTDLSAFQASSRGGYLRVRLNGDRVNLVGKAVTILAGNLLT